MYLYIVSKKQSLNWAIYVVSRFLTRTCDRRGLTVVPSGIAHLLRVGTRGGVRFENRSRSHFGNAKDAGGLASHLGPRGREGATPTALPLLSCGGWLDACTRRTTGMY